MAIYHFSVKTVNRTAKVSAAGRHDYIKRRARYSSDRQEVLYAEDGNMPAWAEVAPVLYWRGADRYERANGRLFKQIEWALPRELTFEEQKKAARELVLAVTQTPDGPLPYSLGLHAGHGRGNPHGHLIVSERVQDGVARTQREWFGRAGDRRAGLPGARKTAALKAKNWLLWIRKTWEDIANHALAAAGIDARIDCRTLEAQGIDRPPQKHRGPARDAMERKRRAEEEEEQTSMTFSDHDAEFLADLAGAYYDEFEEADLAERARERAAGADPWLDPAFSPEK